MSKMRVLFVDDEERVLAGLRRILRPLHDEWEMRFVTSGSAALEALDGDAFDLIVSDVRMPGMDGIELLDRIRDTHPDLIRIILSGYSDQVDTLRSTTVAHQYLAKPCDAGVIRDTVARSTSLRQELTQPQLLAAIATTKTLPSAPSLYEKLTEELASGEPSLRRVGAIVAQDPAMTAKILQIVNSAFFALRRRVSDIDHAVSLLGIDTIMALVLTTHLFNQGRLTSAQSSAVEAIWARSLGVATLAKQISLSDGLSRALAQEAFLAGLLHDAGKLVFVLNWPERAHEVATGDAAFEKATFGADHAVVGAYLLSMWGLPDEVVEAVAYHHSPSRAVAKAAPVLTAVHTAHALEVAMQTQTKPKFDTAHLERSNLTGKIPRWIEVAEAVAYQREYA